MRIWFLLTGIDDILEKYGLNALKALSNDDRYEIIPMDYLNIDLADGKRLAVSYKGEELPLPDAFFPTVSNTDSFCLESLLENAGCKNLADMEDFRVARSKIATYQRLAQNGYSVPNTMIFFNHPNKEKIIEKFGFPFVIKPDNGFGGEGVALIHTEAEMDSYLKSAQYGVAYMAQEYIAESRGKDVRVVFLMGEFMAAYIRRAGDPSEFRSNVHAGGSIEEYEIDEETKKMCAGIAALYNLPVLGIDLLFGDGKFVVTEVNAYPGQQGEYSNRVSSAIVDKALAEAKANK